MKTAQKLILDSYSDTHISEDKILSHESDSEKEETQTNYTTGDRQYTILTFCISNPQVYGGSQWDKKKLSTSCQQRFNSTECHHAVFLEVIQLLVEEKQILPVILGHT